MEYSNIWAAIMSGSPSRAITTLQRAFDAEREYALELGLAHLWLQDYESAFHHFQEAVDQVTPRGIANFYELAGVAKWCMGRRAHAIRQWKAGVAAPYGDAGGANVTPVNLLYFSAVIAPKLMDMQTVDDLLKQRVADPRTAAHWPGPLVHYLAGVRSEKWVLRAVQNEVDAEPRRNLMDFYGALLRLRTGDRNTCRTTMGAIVERVGAVQSKLELFLDCIAVPEFHLARYIALRIGKSD